MNVTGSTQTSTAQSGQSSPAKGGDAVLDFLAYMKETPAQRMEDAWLAAHKLTRKDLADMTPEKRAAVMKQMAEEIKIQLTQQMESKKNKPQV